MADQPWTNGYGSIPMIAMSASTVMVDLARQTPFFQEVVGKPFDIGVLLDGIRRVLSEVRSRGLSAEQGQ